eukprot:3549964-Pyramimonas_sp.AAC.1
MAALHLIQMPALRIFGGKLSNFAVVERPNKGLMAVWSPNLIQMPTTARPTMPNISLVTICAPARQINK